MEQQQQQNKVNIMELSQEELEKELIDTQNLYKQLKESLKDDTSSGRSLRDNLYAVQSLLEALEVEQIRRELKMSELEIPELEEISHDAYRRIRHMENYDWDVVQNSPEENRKGFMDHIWYLEQLQAAANLEIDRRTLSTK